MRVTAWRPIAISLPLVIVGLAGFAAWVLAAQKEAFPPGNVSTVGTSSLHLDALRDLKRVNSHLIEGAAYPVLSAKGALLPTRLRYAAQRT